MEEFCRLSEGGRSYLSLRRENDGKENDGRKENGCEIKMISGCCPESLLPLRIREDSAGRMLEYDVTGLVSLEEMTKDGAGGDAATYLYGVVFALKRLSGILREFMLRAECIVPRPGLTYLKPESGQVYFLYDPGNETPLEESLQQLMEHFLHRLSPVEDREVLLLYGLYQRTREPGLTLESLADYWSEKFGTRMMESAPPAERGIAENDREIYEELGMHVPESNFAKWKKRREIRAENEPLSGIAAPASPEKMLPPPEPVFEMRSFFRKEKEDAVTGAGEMRTVEDRLKRQPLGRFGRLLRPIKKYVFEIAVGAVVLVVAVFLLLR